MHDLVSRVERYVKERLQPLHDGVCTGWASADTGAAAHHTTAGEAHAHAPRWAARGARDAGARGPISLPGACTLDQRAAALLDSVKLHAADVQRRACDAVGGRAAASCHGGWASAPQATHQPLMLLPLASVTSGGSIGPLGGAGGQSRAGAPAPAAAEAGKGKTAGPAAATAPGSAAAAAGSKEPEDRILISDVRRMCESGQRHNHTTSAVEVVGCGGDLAKVARGALSVRPNFAYTLSEVQADVKRVFATGWFAEVAPDAQDTRDGVKLIVKVRPNEEVRALTATGANVLPTSVLEDAFQGMTGRTLNFGDLKRAIAKVDAWYHERGIMGLVSDFSFDNGQIALTCAEAVVNSITLRFVDPATNEARDKPRTKPHIVTRHLTTAPAKVYNLKGARCDINAVYGTGLFEDVNISTKEAEGSTEDQPKVDLVLNLVERKTGGLGCGGGLSAAAAGDGGWPGLIGSFTYNERNLFGLNQRLSASAEIGQIDKLFKLQHTDPWVNSDPHRTSRTVQVLNTRSSGHAVHGRAEADGEDSGISSNSVLQGRLLGGVEWQRPLAPGWSGSLALNWQRTRCLDEKGRPITHDAYRAPVTFTADNNDTAALASVTASFSDPRDESQVLLSLEQALPLVREWLHFARTKARLQHALKLGPGLGLHLRARGGSVIGDLPPYEAFPIGGTNSVRGYSEGGVGSGRHYLEAGAELRAALPIQPLTVVLFCDYGSDLGSGPSVIGDPAGVRQKPGSGYGFGAGLRIDSVVGPVRLEYAWNAKREGRFHVGLGYG